MTDSRAQLSPPVLFSGQKSGGRLGCTAKSICRAISNAFVLNCELFTECSHDDLDNTFSRRVALIFVDTLLQNSWPSKGRWTCRSGEVSFAQKAAEQKGAVGGAHVTFVAIPFHSPNPAPSSVEIGAYNHNRSCPTSCHTCGRDGTG